MSLNTTQSIEMQMESMNAMLNQLAGSMKESEGWKTNPINTVVSYSQLDANINSSFPTLVNQISDYSPEKNLLLQEVGALSIIGGVAVIVLFFVSVSLLNCKTKEEREKEEEKNKRSKKHKEHYLEETEEFDLLENDQRFVETHKTTAVRRLMPVMTIIVYGAIPIFTVIYFVLVAKVLHRCLV